MHAVVRASRGVIATLRAVACFACFLAQLVRLRIRKRVRAWFFAVRREPSCHHSDDEAEP